MFEMTKGKASYWYPYLRQMPDVQYGSKHFWNPDELSALQDEKCHWMVIEQDADANSIWKAFKQILSDNKPIFPDKFIDKDLFFNLYGQVCKRCFGGELNSVSIIPMVDNLNHGNIKTTNEIICLPLHRFT